MKYQFHPVAEVFPLMSDEDLDLLAADISAQGQLQPILVYNGQIIDGRNRYLACEQLNIVPVIQPFLGTEADVIAYVVSLNLRRRHLNESQIGIIAARLVTMRQGERTDLEAARFGENDFASREAKLSQSSAADLMGVGRSTVQRAVKVLESGVPELVEKIEDGELTVTEAARIAEMPRTKQKRLLIKGREATRELSRKLIEKRAVEINRTTGVVCLNCNPQLEITEETLLVHLTKLMDRAPRRFERYFFDILEELEEAMGEGVAAQNRSDRVLVADAISRGYRTKEQIRHYTKLDKSRVSSAISVMLEFKEILPKIQGGKTEVARGQRKEFFVMNDKRASVAATESDQNTEFDDFDSSAASAVPTFSLNLPETRAGGVH